MSDEELNVNGYEDLLLDDDDEEKKK